MPRRLLPLTTETRAMEVLSDMVGDESDLAQRAAINAARYERGSRSFNARLNRATEWRERVERDPALARLVLAAEALGGFEAVAALLAAAP